MKDIGFSQKAKDNFVRRFHKSGLPLGLFCRQESISQGWLRAWIKRRGVYQSQQAGVFLPIGLAELNGCLYPVLLA